MKPLHKLFLGFLLVVSVAAIAIQMPAINNVRNEAFDQRAAADLRVIEYAIEDHQRDKGQLPLKLTDVDIDEKLEQSVTNYTYQRKSSSKYQLCADFKTDTEGTEGVDRSLYPTSSSYVDYSKHPKGNHCFDLTANASSSYYSPYNKPELCLNGLCGTNGTDSDRAY